MVAGLAEQRALDDFVLLHVHLELEVPLAHGAAEDLHQVPLHRTGNARPRLKGSAGPRAFERRAKKAFPSSGWMGSGRSSEEFRQPINRSSIIDHPLPEGCCDLDDEKGWPRDSWRTGVVLALLLGLAFFLRVYFVWGLFYPAGFISSKGDYSGGSDPFYWERAMFYTLQTGKEISRDLAMNYPICFPDVRPPLFAWFNVLAGYMTAPFLGNARDASVFMLNLNAAILGTLTLIPTSLLGKEAFGKRVGIIATLLLAISAAALQRSRWVENWFQLASVRKGFRAFFRDNEKSVLYAGLAGMSVAVTALSWQGWAYVPVILVLVYVVELMLDRIRNQDVLGITILFAVIFATPLIVSFPWYYVRGLIKVWWDVPFYLFAVALVLGIVFSVTRDNPWTLVIPATFVAGA